MITDPRITEYQWLRKSDRMTVAVADLTFEELQAALCDTIDAIEDIAAAPHDPYEVLKIVDNWRIERTA